MGAREHEGEAGNKLPESLAHYTILSELGAGAQGQVLLAQDTHLDRKVAIKVLPATVGFRHGERFKREAALASRLDHPGICPIYDAGEANGTSYIAMRYVDGETLADLIAREKESQSRETSTIAPSSRAELQDTLRLFEATARALHAAHESGLVHRDIKPGNIMVDKQGNPVIVDFGLAHDETSEKEQQQLTFEGDLLGTPAYMSPEQLLAQRIALDRRTDIYSLGITLYECLTLTQPFEAPTREGLYKQILMSEFPDPTRINRQLGKDLKVVIETACDKDRDRRYQTAEDFAEDLRRVREVKPIRARPIGPLLRFRRWTQRRPALATAVIATFVLLALGLGLSLVLLGRVNDALRESRVLGLAAASNQAVATDPMLAVLLAREAVRLEERSESLSALQHALANHHELRVFFEPEARRGTIRFSDDGTRLLTAGFGVELWDLDGNLVREFTHPNGEYVYDVVFTPDGQGIASAGKDMVARLWSMDGNVVREFSGHEGHIRDVDVSPDGEWLLTAARDNTARLWKMDGTPGPVLRGHTGGLTEGAFAPDGSWVVTAGDDDVARIWNLDGTVRHVLRGHRGDVQAVEVSPDGTIATAGHDQTIRLWNADGELLLVIRGHTDRLYGVSFCCGGQRILTASADGTARLWDLAGNPLLVLRGHHATVDCAVQSPDGRLIATAARDNTVRLWEVASRDLPALHGHALPIQQVRFSPHGDRLLTCSEDGTVRIWHRDGTPLRAFKPEDSSNRLEGSWGADEIFGADFSPDGSRVLVGVGTAVQTWTVDGVLQREMLGHTDIVWSVDLSSDGQRIASASWDHLVKIWNTSGVEVQSFDCGDRNQDVAFSRDGRYLAAAGDTHLILFEYDGTKYVRLRELPGHEGYLYSVRFSPDGTKVLASSVAHATVYLWDLGGKILQTFEHVSSARQAVFWPDGTKIVTAGTDGAAHVWNLDGTKCMALKAYGGSVHAVDVSADGRYLLTGSSDYTARVWLLDPQDLMALADRRAFRDFTPAERTRYAGLLGD